MSDTQKQLQRAYRLINKQKTDEALSLLRPLVQQEPENPDVWWLMAYALENPQEVREALITVLRLNPNYSNAPKARELLQSLNEQHPPTQDEVLRFPDFLQQFSAFPDAFAPEADDLFSSARAEPLPFDDSEDIFADGPFGQSFESSAMQIDEDELYSTDVLDSFEADQAFDDSVFMLDGEDSEVVEAEEKLGKKSRQERRAEKKQQKEAQKAAKAAEEQLDDVTRLARELGIDPEALDDDILAELEEKSGQRNRAGARAARILLAAIVLLIVAAVGIVLGTGDGDTSSDPGSLEAADAAVVDLASIERDVLAANLGAQSRVLVAETKLGPTLFIEFCGQPNASLPATVMRGMTTMTGHGPALQGQVDAIGVSVNDCSDSEPDTLYRAFVPLQDAVAYSEGIKSEDSASAFQALWQTP